MEEAQDIFGRQYKQLIPYRKALKRFLQFLAFARAGATPVYEVVSYPINNVEGVKKALHSVPTGAAVWQHTDKWHTAAIYIKAGYGRKFSRQIINLFAHGITSEEDFKRIWIEQNGEYELGVFPKSSGSYPTASRKKQASYIVVDKNKPENEDSKIEGSFQTNQVHRTHLISAQTTGIEQNKGLLIDFDGWLNTNPMNQFETRMLNLAKHQDLVWTANVWIGKDEYLHFKYQMYDKNYKLIEEEEYIDDRWTYLWYYDQGQDKLSSY